MYVSHQLLFQVELIVKNAAFDRRGSTVQYLSTDGNPRRVPSGANVASVCVRIETPLLHYRQE